MGSNSSPAGTQHIRMIASRALESSKGVMIEVSNRAEAMRLRNLFHAMRFKDRKDARKIYPEGHPQHGLSAYDGLETIVECRGGTFCMIIQPVMAGLSRLKITDNESGEIISPEDLI